MYCRVRAAAVSPSLNPQHTTITMNNVKLITGCRCRVKAGKFSFVANYRKTKENLSHGESRDLHELVIVYTEHAVH